MCGINTSCSEIETVQGKQSFTLKVYFHTAVLGKTMCTIIQTWAKNFIRNWLEEKLTDLYEIWNAYFCFNGKATIETTNLYL
jgi:hypothetical protein